MDRGGFIYCINMTDITKIKKLKDRVEYILMEYPDTRNNDRLLTWTYWEVFDSDLWRSAWGRKDRHSIGKKEYIK